MIPAFFLGYFLGSIPFGLLLARAAGLGDIRAVGSGNIGATNVLRTGRKDLAAATLLLDAAKGVAAVFLASAILGPRPALAAGFGALLGHVAPIWLGFRGGKGVATGFGVLLAVFWPVGVACLVVWLAVAFVTRRSSAAALAAFLFAPIAAFLAAGPDRGLLALLLALVVFLRHSANIRRLLAGTEPRIGASE